MEYREPCAAIESWPQKKILYLMVEILAPIIYLEEFYLPSRLCLNKDFEIFEMLKDLRFLLEKEIPSVA
jgi:hypothetical protein